MGPSAQPNRILNNRLFDDKAMGTPYLRTLKSPGAERPNILDGQLSLGHEQTELAVAVVAAIAPEDAPFKAAAPCRRVDVSSAYLRLGRAF